MARRYHGFWRTRLVCNLHSATLHETLVIVLGLAIAFVTATGLVTIDANRDGTGDTPAANIVVSWEGKLFTRTDAQGRYRIDLGTQTSTRTMIWARVPAGFEPGKAWARLGDGAESINVATIVLRPESTAAIDSPLSFAVAADSHVVETKVPSFWESNDVDQVLGQIAGLRPRFLTIVGDMTQANRATEFRDLIAAVDKSQVPFVPVPGNHDWYDGGAAYRSFFGPDNYSFDAGNWHFVVWNTIQDNARTEQFIRDDLALVAPGTKVAALGHFSPDEKQTQMIANLGVDVLFTGHWHANRVVRTSGLVEYNTQTLLMGGLDGSPAGFRMVQVFGDDLYVEHVPTASRSWLEVATPVAGICTDAGDVHIAITTLGQTGRRTVQATVDGEQVNLQRTSEVAFAGDKTLEPGKHTLLVQSVDARGTATSREHEFEVCEASTATGGEWQQEGGGEVRTHATTLQLAPPLSLQWSVNLPGINLRAPVVVSAGLVIATVSDLGAGTLSGVAAYELSTGARRWFVSSQEPLRASASVERGVVVVVASSGLVRGLNLGDGFELWRQQVALAPKERRGIESAPLISNDTVFVGNQNEAVALDLASGKPKWRKYPKIAGDWMASYAAPIVQRDQVIFSFGRETGLQWFDKDGSYSGSYPGIGIYGSPVSDGQTIYFADSEGVVKAIRDRKQQWSTKIDPSGFDWSHSITAPLAVLGNTVVTATHFGELTALDTKTGSIRWRYRGGNAAMKWSHYRNQSDGWVSAPIITGGLVWAGDAAGNLVALDVATGDERAKYFLGSPVASAPTPAGEMLLVVTYDGTLRAFRAVAPKVKSSNGCATGAESASGPFTLGVLLLLWRKRRRLA